MTRTEASSIVDQVCSRFVGTKQDHINIATALEVIKAALEQSAELPAEPVEG